MGRNLIYLLVIALVVYSIIDCLRSDDDERAGMPKWLWVVLMVLFPLVGSIVYLVISRSARTRRRAPAGPGAGGAAATRGGAPAPDDDPEFLWRLEQKRRQDERDARRDQPDAGGVTNGDGTDDAPR